MPPREPAPRVRRRGPVVAILVYNVDSTGGMERQAALLARTLARQGRRVVLVSTFFPRRGLGLAERDRPLRERREGVQIYRIPIFTNLLWNYLASQNLYELCAAWLLQKHRAQLIYAVQAQTGGVHAARLGRLLELPAVVKLACSGPSGDVAMALETPQGRTVYDHLRALDRVVSLNDESRDEARGVGVSPERLLAIPNGIDAGRFDPATVAPADLAFTKDTASAASRQNTPEVVASELVLFVGRLSPQKRVAVLLDAFALVAAKRPRARLAIAGQGPARPELEARARDLGITAQVSFLGVRDDVPRLLRAAAVFALPSAEEGQSNALLEAMAAGTPAVASDIAGNRALARDGVDALLVPVDDAAALARGLERLLEDRPLASRLAASARARVLESYSIESVARRYAALFDSLATRPAPSFARFVSRYAFSQVWGVFGILAYVLRETAIQLGPPAWAAAVRGVKRVLGLPVNEPRRRLSDGGRAPSAAATPDGRSPGG